jgi:PAS domain-containing protein
LLKRTLIQISDPGTILSDLTGLQEMSNGSRDSYSREKRYERKDGSHVWCSVNVSLLRGPDPDCDCFVVVLHDISARKEIEEDLARTNELLTISQNAGGTGSFEWIVPENSLTWSQNHIDMFGLSSSGFDGSFVAWQKCVGADDLARVEAEIQSAFASRREDWHTEYRIILADTSEERWITSRGRISYDSRGKPHIMVGISIDTTERKLAEKELLRTREDLEQHVHQRTTELVQKTLEISEQARQLDQANDSLRQLSVRILQLQDEERRRIAAHLHDSTGGWITALAMNLSVVQAEASQITPKGEPSSRIAWKSSATCPTTCAPFLTCFIPRCSMNSVCSPRCAGLSRNFPSAAISRSSWNCPPISAAFRAIVKPPSSASFRKLSPTCTAIPAARAPASASPATPKK